MLDFDLTGVYGYTTAAFNRQVNHNIERFDNDFRFQLNQSEWDNLRCKIYTANTSMIRYLPYAFTEQGIYMLAGVLRRPQAIEQHEDVFYLFSRIILFVFCFIH